MSDISPVLTCQLASPDLIFEYGDMRTKIECDSTRFQSLKSKLSDESDETLHKAVCHLIETKSYTMDGNVIYFEKEVLIEKIKFSVVLREKTAMEYVKELLEENKNLRARLSSLESIILPVDNKHKDNNEDLTEFGEEIKDFVFPWQQFHEWLMNPPQKVVDRLSEIKNYKLKYDNTPPVEYCRKYFKHNNTTDNFVLELFKYHDQASYIMRTFLSTIGIRVIHKSFNVEDDFKFHKTKTSILYSNDTKSILRMFITHDKKEFLWGCPL